MMRDSNLLSYLWFMVMAIGGSLTLILGRRLPYVSGGMLKILKRSKKHCITYSDLRVTIRKRYSLWVVICVGFAVVMIAWIVFMYTGGYDDIVAIAERHIGLVLFLVIISLLIHFVFGVVLVAFAIMACLGREEYLMEYVSENYKAVVVSELAGSIRELLEIHK